MGPQMNKKGFYFIVEGPPQGKARARTFMAGKRAVTWTPTKTREYEKLIQWSFKSQCKGSPIPKDVPVSMTVYAFYGPKKSYSKVKYQKCVEGAIYPLKKPDIDNVFKLLADALQGYAYEDDIQVIETHCYKRYSATDRVEVEVCQL